MRKTLPIISLLLLTLSMVMGAQEGEGRKHYLFTTGIVNPKSPEASGMVQYGNAISSNLYTGTMRLSIPVYTYRDLDFEIPISLEYASSGFKPNMTSGVLGEGWTLNAGGAITREIRGIMDDATPDFELYSYGNKLRGSTAAAKQDPPPDVSGYIYFSDNGPVLESDSDLDYVYLNKAGEEYMAILRRRNSNDAYEMEPDIFTFSMPGHSGSFAFRPGKQVCFFGTTEGARGYWLEHEISALRKQLSSMTIHSPERYAYEFSYAEMSHNVASDGSDDGINTPGSWRLTKITAPNGRYVSFSYGESAVSCTMLPVAIRDIRYKISRDRESPEDETEDEATVTRDFFSMTDVTCGCLTEISASDGEFRILFTYSEKAPEPGTLSDGKKLDRIDVLNRDGDTVRTCSLNYRNNDTAQGSAYSSTSSSRTFLDAVKISGTGEYSMDYNDHGKETPAVDTWGIDWYGYWRPNTTQNSFLPSGISTSDAAMISNRKPDTLAIKYGCLTKIAYPTGGLSTFRYDANKYSEDLTGADTSSRGGLASGVRIGQIDTYDMNGSLRCRRSFRYIKEDGNSSGRLLWRPVLWCRYQGRSTGFSTIYRQCVSTASDFIFSGKPAIEYLRVEDHTSGITGDNGDEGLSVTTFVSARYPAALEYYAGFNYDVPEETGLECHLEPDSYTEKLIERLGEDKWSAFRGCPDTVTVYSSSQEHPISRTIWHYTWCSAGENINETSVLGMYAKHFTSYYYPFPAKRISILYAADGTKKADTTYFSKDGLYRLSSVRFRDSAGRLTETEYEYHNKIPGYVTMETAYRDDILYRRTMYDMKWLRDSLYVPDALRTAVIGSSVNSPEYISEYVTERAFDNYDYLGRPRLITDRHGVATSVTWDGQNPSAISTKAGTDASLTTSYVWESLVGMTREVSPSGRTLRYGYDSAGRLVGTEDSAGNVILINNYNMITDREAEP